MRRGAHAAAIARDGLTMRSVDGDVTLPIPVFDNSNGIDRLDLGDDEIVIVAVKSDETVAVVEALAEVAPPSVALALRPERCRERAGRAAVVRRRAGDVRDAAGRAPRARRGGGLLVARPGPARRRPLPERRRRHDRGGSPTRSTRAGFESIARPDVMRWKHAKLLMNLSNVIEAASGRDGRRRTSWARAPARKPGRATTPPASTGRPPRRTASGAATRSRSARSTAHPEAAGRPGRASCGAPGASRPTTSTARSSCSAGSTACPRR